MLIFSFLKSKNGFFLSVWFLCLLIPLAFLLTSYEKFETIKWCLWLGITGIIFFNLARAQQTLNKVPKVIGYAIGLMLVWALISVLWAPQFWTGFLGTYPRFTNGWLFYFIWSMFLCVILSKIPKADYSDLLKLLIFTGGLVAILGIVQSVFGLAFYEGVDRSAVARAPSFLGNPNFSSMFLASLLPLVFYFFYSAVKVWPKIYYLLLLFFYFFGILTFSSRGAWLALLAGLTVVLFLIGVYRLSFKLILSYGLFCIVGIAIFFSNTNLVRPETVKNTINFTESNLNSRLLVWNMAKEGIQAHPVFGVGLGNFQLYFETHRGATFADHNGVYDDVHNLWLQQAVSGGLGFALSFLFLLVYACRLLYERFKLQAELKDIALLASLVAWAVSASFNPVALPNFLLLAVLLANIFSDRLKDLLAEPHTPGVNPRKLTKVYYLMSGMLITFAGGLFLGELSFFYGLQAFNQQKYTGAQKWFQVAKIINPINRLSESYFVATQIILNPSGQHEQAIQQAGRWEMKDANTLATQAKLFYLWFVVDKNNFQHLEQAIIKLRESIAIDSFYPQRYFRLGYYLAERGKLEEARETVKYGLTLYNKDVAGWVLLARIYQLEHKPKQMTYAIDKAFQLQPMLPEVRFLQRFLKTHPLDYQQYIIPAQIDSLDF